MLGKTANGLFWMYRSLERAENASRLIETGQRIALTRLGSTDEEWRSILQTAGVSEGFDAVHDEISKEAAIDWMLRNRDNGSSVMASIAAARHNARMVRTALTHEVWEAMNRTYMRASKGLARKVSERDLPGVLNDIRQGTALVRGATHGTLLRNDIYDFTRLGAFLERADNTARLIDVKYYVLLPSMASVGSTVDNVQWETLLRAVSGRGGYRMEYGATPNPRDIAEYLILNKRMPRSLAFCVRKLRGNLSYLAGEYGHRSTALTKVDHLERTYLSHDIDAVFDFGLHEYIQHILGLIGDLGDQVQIDFRFYE